MIKCIFPNLVALMAEKNLSVSDIAKAIDRQTETTRKKLAGTNPFSLNEAIMLQEALFPEIQFKVLYSRTAEVGNYQA